MNFIFFYIISFFYIYFLYFLIIFIIIYSKEWILKIKKNLIIFLLIIFSFSLPLVKMAIFEKGASRMQELIGIKKEKVEEIVRLERYGSIAPAKIRVIMHNKVIVWLREIKNNYLEHFSLNFWYLYGDNSLRYFTGNMGMFYLFELPFLILGFSFLLKEKTKEAIFFLGWILLAPIPAALVGRSFAVRSLAILPAPFVFVSAGIYHFWQKFKELKLKNVALIILFCGFMFALGSYLLRYHLDYPAYAATWWGWENKVAIDYAKEHENEYEKIFISDYYTGTTLAFAFYEKLDPLFYRQSLANPLTFGGNHQFIKFGKFYIGSFALEEKNKRQKIIPEKSLYIAGPMEPDGQAVITSPDDGRILFKIHDTLR